MPQSQHCLSLNEDRTSLLSTLGSNRPLTTRALYEEKRWWAWSSRKIISEGCNSARGVNKKPLHRRVLASIRKACRYLHLPPAGRPPLSHICVGSLMPLVVYSTAAWASQ